MNELPNDNKFDNKFDTELLNKNLGFVADFDEDYNQRLTKF